VKEANNLTAQASKVDYWTVFAREAKRGHSPLYERFAAGIGETPSLQAMAARVKKGQPPANILLGSVHYLLLRGEQHPLADYYPSVRPNGRPSGDPFPLFKDFCATFEQKLLPLIETRVTNTNEVARSSTLYPAFDFVAREAGEPLHLIEIGPSAGFNLNWDRYRYTFKRDRDQVIERGPADSRLHLTAELRGDRLPPLAEEMPRVANRVGLELNPVDLSRPEDRLWLKALIWPEHAPRFARLEGAIAEALSHPQRIQSGNALALLPEAVGALPPGGAIVVYHSHVTYQFSDAMRAQLNETLVTLARTRPVYRISIEWDGAYLKTYEGNYPINVGLYDGYNEPTKRTIAYGDPHGAWIEWKV
jgi:hypothetical protein